MSDYKSDFIRWLDRFAYLGVFGKTIRQMKFSQDELEKMKPQITARYRLKKEFARKQGA